MKKSTMVELVTELEEIYNSNPCEEIAYMIKEARSGEFHDYKNRKYACGKMGFVAIADAFGKRNPSIAEALGKLSNAIKNGDYDESPDDIDNMVTTNMIMRDNSMNQKQREALLTLLGLKKKNYTPFGKQYF